MFPRKPVATWVTQSQQTLETLMGSTRGSLKNSISHRIIVSCSWKTTKRNVVWKKFGSRFLKTILKSSGGQLRLGKYWLRKSKQPWFISTPTNNSESKAECLESIYVRNYIRMGSFISISISKGKLTEKRPIHDQCRITLHLIKT